MAVHLRLAAGTWIAGIGLTAAASAQSFVADLVPPNLQADEDFGRALAIDGRRIVVGAPQKGPQWRGRGYLFDARDGSFGQPFVPTNWKPQDNLGRAVAVSGNFVLLGALRDDIAVNVGGVYVYDMQHGVLAHELVASDAWAKDAFGTRIAADGDLALIASPEDDDNGPESGSVYLFDIPSGSELRKLTASDGAASERFGRSLAIHGRLAVIGSLAKVTWPDQGAAYVFDVNTGAELFKLTAADGDEGDLLGHSVAIDGDRIVVGAPRHDLVKQDGGAAYVFDANDGQLLFKLVSADMQVGDFFGGAVAIDGRFIAVASPQSDGAGDNTGSVTVFDRDTGAELYEVVAPDAQTEDRFGTAIAMDGARLVVGAPTADGAGMDSGEAYLFCLTGDVGTSYCGPANLHSAGSSGEISALGASDPTCNTFELTAASLPPDRFGFFLVARDAAFVPFVGGSDGNLCLGGEIGRFQDSIQSSGGAGTFVLALDLTDMPAPMQPVVMTGETWMFQAWFRDANPGPTSNMTDGLSVTFDG